MRLSVVVTVYNLERFVEAAIDSVFAQTRPADEVIVVDDCSTDGSPARIQRYGDRVRYLRMPVNSGALPSSLAGVRLATGDVVCMLDGDDVWAPNKLEVVARDFAADPGLVLHSHQHVRVNERLEPLDVRDDTHDNIRRIQARTADPRERSALYRDSILAQRGYWLGSAYSFRAAAFQRERFDGQLRSFASGALRSTYLDLAIGPFLVVTNPGGTVGYTDDTYFLYRLHGNASLSNNTTVAGALASLSKGRSVNALTYHLLEQNGAPTQYLDRRRLLIGEYDYLASVYRGERAIALRGFARLARRLWSAKTARKEAARLLGTLVLGPDRFLRIKQARHARATG